MLIICGKGKIGVYCLCGVEASPVPSNDCVWPICGTFSRATPVIETVNLSDLIENNSCSSDMFSEQGSNSVFQALFFPIFRYINCDLKHIKVSTDVQLA